MRELRKDVNSGLEPPKEELENLDEMKIEDVLMGLKGLKQEEVFSFLGKNNFTPAETEMSATGFSGYDHLPTVDAVEMEQLQLSFGGHFEGAPGSIGQAKSDFKLKFKNESKSTVNHFATISKTQSAISAWEAEDLHQRASSTWPKYPGTHTYSLDEFHVEELREEEIIATSIGEEMITTSNADDEDDFKYTPNNTYVIQSSVDRVVVPDKPKPIKLLIKRVESEDDVSTDPDLDSSVTRIKAKRDWNSSSKLQVEESPPKKRKNVRRSLQMIEEKVDLSTIHEKQSKSIEEHGFPFSNTVHQDDDFVYPSLGMSDDEEEDIYSFSQRDDETWTPKIRMKMNEVKPQRPTRNRKQNSAVAKYLEAVAQRRANAASRKSSKKSHPKLALSNTRTMPIRTYPSVVDVSHDRVGQHPFNCATTTCVQSLASRSLPSTSSAVTHLVGDHHSTLPPPPSSAQPTVVSARCPPPVTSNCSFSSSSPSCSEELLLSTTPPVRRGRKAKPKIGAKTHKKLHLRADFKGSRLIPPKTCKLLHMSRGAVVATLQLGVSSAVKQRVKDNASHPATSASSPANAVASVSADKKVPSSYITKRGKPKKGMATAKQRLGKILKMHKMFL